MCLYIYIYIYIYMYIYIYTYSRTTVPRRPSPHPLVAEERIHQKNNCGPFD